MVLFVQRMMALYVASHYKNSPNDLQLMADAPAHHLFVLLGINNLGTLTSFICATSRMLILNSHSTGPVDESKNHLPDILCVIQVSLLCNTRCNIFCCYYGALSFLCVTFFCNVMFINSVKMSA